MSAQTLADLTAELGHPIQRPVLTNLENGRRSSVTVTDMLVLARALNVPPFALLAPLTSDEPVEILPGRFMTPWNTVDWFNGESNYVSDVVTQRDTGFQDWYRETDAYELRFRYKVAMRDYLAMLTAVEEAGGDAPEHQVKALQTQLRYVSQLREALDAQGVTGIPPLSGAEESASG